MRAVLLAALLGVELATARPGQKGREPMLGWNTWCTQNTCGVDWCTSSEVLDVAASMKSSGMLDLGYDHINLDDCWGVRDPTTHQIMGDPVRFPEGMKAFIAKLHAMGFKFGLYTDIGPNGCHHPFTGSYPLYQQDADTFADWGVDYVKFDGCDQPEGHSAEELTCNMSKALLNTGKDIWFNFHCWHTESCAECGTSYRVGPDHHDNWDSTRGVIDLLAHNRMPFWGPDPEGGWPDPDFVYTGGQGCNHTDPGPNHGNPGPNPPGVRCPGQTEDEYITEMSIWALAGGQIIISSDPRNMTAFQKKLWFNEEVLAIYKDVSGFAHIAMVGNGSAPRPLAAAGACALERTLSTAPCTAGESYGCFPGNNSMWTDAGCRGVFTCDGVAGVPCDDMGHGKNVCPCKAGPIPPSPPPRPGHHDNSPQVWARPTADGGAAIALFNPDGDSKQTITVHFATVPAAGWTASTKLKVRNVWDLADLGVSTGSYSATVNPHGTVLLKLTAATTA